MNVKKRECLTVIFAAGLLWLGSGAANVAAQLTTGTETRGTRLDLFTATVANDRVCRTTATELETIPGTTVKFTQHGNKPQPVVVTFVATWPLPDASEIPAGSQAAGALIFLFIDGNRVDPISNFGGVLVHEGTASSVSNGTHGFTFVTDPIAAGDHVATISFLDNVLGPFGVPNGTICVQERSTVVEHD
jgi:hypothetical protein